MTTVYDAAGRPLSIDSGTRVVCRSYSADGRLTQEAAKKDSEGALTTTTYTYDPDGNVLAVNEGGAPEAITNVYNEAGWLLETEDASAAIGAKAKPTYDLEGNVTQRLVQLPNGGASYTSTFQYDTENRVTSQTDPAGRTYGFLYDSRDLLYAINYPNNTFVWRKANDAALVSDIHVRHGQVTTPGAEPADSDPIVEYAYSYFQNGQRKSETRTGGTGGAPLGVTGLTSYAYDPVGRLEQTTFPGSLGSRRYCFDRNSNRTGYTASAGTARSTPAATYTYSTSAPDRLQSVTAGATTAYTYDADGNVTGRGGTILSWDRYGRHSWVTLPGANGLSGVDFTVDGAVVGTVTGASPFTKAIDTTTLQDGWHTIGTVAVTAAGNRGAAPTRVVRVANTPADAPPSVSLTAPADGSTLTGTVSVSAAASDNIGVAAVQFRRDGVDIGADTTSPYSINWDSSTAPSGTHTLTAVAIDGAGNATTSTPVTVTVSGGAPAVAAGSAHGLALKPDGTVWAWGANYSYQLGNGTTISSSTPVQVSSLSGVVAIAAGGDHSLALKSNGTVWGWGSNGVGQLCNGTTALATTPSQSASGLSGVVALAAGSQTTLLLKSDGTVWACGSNSHGQLGNGTNTNSSTPVQVSNLSDVVAIAAGQNHSWALKSNGTVWAWGNNADGQLGNATTTNSSIPVQVSNLSTVAAINGGLGNHSVAVKSDGTVWGWGANWNGQLGNGATGKSTTAVQASNLTGITALSTGSGNTVALKSDGTVRAWGANSNGELGNGTTTDSHIPVQVSNLSGITGIASGSANSLAVKSDGSIWAWGANWSGQLGNGTTTNATTPVPVNAMSGDSTPPTVSITAPPAGASLSGTVTVSATASDNVGVAAVQFRRDGVDLGADTTSPYSVSWNTSVTPNGSHTLTAVALDSTGNTTTSTGVAVTLGENTPPTIPGTPNVAATPGSAQLSWSASSDASGIAYYRVHRSTVSSFTPTSANEIGQTTLTSYTDNGDGTTSGLPAGTYYYKIVALDRAGNPSTASSQGSGLVTANTSLPQAALTAPTPASGATVAGSITVASTASSATSGDTNVSYGFDPVGFRFTRTLNGTTTRYLLGGLIETNSAGTITLFDVDGPLGDLAHYTAPPTPSQQAVTFLYHSAHGDLAAESNTTGIRTAAYTYDPFGAALEATAANTTTERWTGQWDKKLDTTSGLIEMGARPYDPTLGRFLAVDPIVGGALNDYDYAGQDPINGYDLDGLAVDPSDGTSQGKWIVDQWYRSTSRTTESAVRYHLREHGGGRSALRYTQDAIKFRDANWAKRTPHTLEDGTNGFKIRGPNQQFGIYSADGRIVSYGYAKPVGGGGGGGTPPGIERYRGVGGRPENMM